MAEDVIKGNIKPLNTCTTRIAGIGFTSIKPKLNPTISTPTATN